MRVFLRAFGAVTALCLALAFDGAPVRATIQPNQLSTTAGTDVLVCSGRPWIDVKCYGAMGDDSHDDTSAINSAIADALLVAGGAPVHFPVGTYKVTGKLTWDYAGISGSGLQIISEGAAIDGVSIGSGNVLQIKCSGGTVQSPAQCNNLRLVGSLTVKGNTPAYVVLLGDTNFDDEHLGAHIDHLVATNASTNVAAGGIQVNFVGPDSDLWLSGTTAGGAASVSGVAIEQLQNSRLAGYGSTAGASGAALLIENGTSIGDLVSGFGYGAASNTCLSITSATAAKNTFLSPVYGCTTAINAPQSANGNIIVAPSFSGANQGPLSTGISLVGRGGLSRYSAPSAASYTAAGVDDGLILSAANGTGPAAGWASVSLPVTLPMPSQVGAGWTMGFVTDGGKAVVLNPPGGVSLLAGGQALSTMTLGPGNYQIAVVASDGTNFRVLYATPATLTINGADAKYPWRWIYPGGPGYQATQGDNGNAISSSLTSGGLTVTLPSTSVVASGWTVSLMAAGGQNMTVQPNASSGGTIVLSDGTSIAAGASTMLPFQNEITVFQFDGANWRQIGGVDRRVNLHVPNNAALKAIPAGSLITISRDGFASAGDGGGAYYLWQTANCAHADDGWQVQPSVGTGCWKAVLGGQTDLRLWGTLGTADDTSVWNAADSAIGVGLNTAILCSVPTFIKNASISNIKRVVGTSQQDCVINLAASAGTGDFAMIYVGAGPFTIENASFVGPLYDATQVSPPQVAGSALLRLGPGGGSANPIARFTGRHLRFTGGQTGTYILQTEYVYLDDVFTDRNWGWGWVIDPFYDSAGVRSQHVVLNNIRGRGEGNYCGSLFDTGGNANAAAPRDVVATNMRCDASGFIGNKYCFDVTGRDADQVVFEGSGINCQEGGVELKTALSGGAITVTPDVYRNIRIEFAYYSNIDTSQTGLSINYETSDTITDKKRNIFADGYATWSAPAVWKATWYYDVGDVVTNGGNTYLATAPGTSAASGGPSGTTTIADGSVEWRYVEATPSVPTAMTACILEAATDVEYHCHAQGTAYGYEMLFRGSSDLTIRRADLYFDGTVQKNCLADYSGFNNGTADRMRLINWACRTVGALGFSAIDLGNATGTTYTNFEIVGGSFVNDAAAGGTPSGFAFRNSGATITGTISGAPRLSGYNACIYLSGTSTTNLTWNGGGSCETLNASASAPITSAASTAGGTITLKGELGIANANPTNHADWENLSGTPLTVLGRLIDGVQAAVPGASTKCNWGQIFRSSQPGNGGQPVNGWYAAAVTGGPPPTCTWTAF